MLWWGRDDPDREDGGGRGVAGGHLVVSLSSQTGAGPRGHASLHSFLLVCQGPRRECFSVQAPEEDSGEDVNPGDCALHLQEQSGVLLNPSGRFPWRTF